MARDSRVNSSLTHRIRSFAPANVFSSRKSRHQTPLGCHAVTGRDRSRQVVAHQFLGCACGFCAAAHSVPRPSTSDIPAYGWRQSHRDAIPSAPGDSRAAVSCEQTSSGDPPVRLPVRLHPLACASDSAHWSGIIRQSGRLGAVNTSRLLPARLLPDGQPLLSLHFSGERPPVF